MEHWQARCQLEAAGPPSLSLLPMFYANLIADLGGPETTLLKGVYRRTWYGNQLALAQLRRLLDRLSAQDVGALALNDAALVAGHYPDIGHRTIACLDVLVRARDWESSIAAATEEGWKAEPGKSFGSPGSLSVMAFGGPERPQPADLDKPVCGRATRGNRSRISDQAGCAQVNEHPAPIVGPLQQLLCASTQAVMAKEVQLILYADAALLRPVDHDPVRVGRAGVAGSALRAHPAAPQHAGVSAGPAFRSGSQSVAPALYKMAISHAGVAPVSPGVREPAAAVQVRLPRHVAPLLPRCPRAT